MKDSQHGADASAAFASISKANNERFSTARMGSVTVFKYIKGE